MDSYNKLLALAASKQGMQKEAALPLALVPLLWQGARFAAPHLLRWAAPKLAQHFARTGIRKVAPAVARKLLGRNASQWVTNQAARFGNSRFGQWAGNGIANYNKFNKNHPVQDMLGWGVADMMLNGGGNQPQQPQPQQSPQPQQPQYDDGFLRPRQYTTPRPNTGTPFTPPV